MSFRDPGMTRLKRLARLRVMMLRSCPPSRGGNRISVQGDAR